MTIALEPDLEDRLVRYCAVDTQSDLDSPTTPSTACQLDLSRMLVAELEAMGAEDVVLTEYGAVLATVPGNAPGPTIGFLGHVDTAPQFNATGVKPRVIRGYNGGEITYPDDPALVLSPEVDSYLGKKVGEDIVCASGLTLLGADDKAGVAIVMSAAQYLLEHPEVPRPTLRLAFTPDEEIGRGVHGELPTDLAVDFAYTFDGGVEGEIVYESFSADQADVVVKGVSIHPGYATGQMVNAAYLAAKIVQALPLSTMTPETTSGREGFLHVTNMEGGSSEMHIRLILRDFEREGLAAKGDLLRQVCAAVQAGEPRAKIEVEITPTYRNMRYWLEDDMTPVELAREACRGIGIEPFSQPIRGGTDGSRLTEMGVPTPNLFTGMRQIHGPLEWVSVQDMGKAAQLMLGIVGLAVQKDA
ncbi:MAG: peptidase T [Sagittula sp.]|jgi:tripeptide aminopeptidase|uniref:peptidase T n=1 Tax=unclassified Sagittula TaxID=2624628 RepID=UPI000C2D0D60|nr:MULTISPECIES: peptidase T [unclassified Sagittula]AUC55610.1 peptidase T [Sagittula sp. P11]WHZ37221.1 peptidase T [Sagittula sp. MA-2]